MKANNNSVFEITILIQRYNELFDKGNMEAASAMFAHAKLKLTTDNELMDYRAFLTMLHKVIKVYPDGKPKTRNVVTNPIIKIDEENGKATGYSHYTIYQATDDLPFQAIEAGRYHDEFERVNGQWRFTYRDFTQFDFRGNVDYHLNLESVL